MKERELRRRCKRELRELNIQPPLRVEELCRQLGNSRNRPIRLVPHPLPVPGPFGAWIATESTDYILYQQETTKVHQDHIILHEVGHIMAGHRSGEPGQPLWRTSYDEAREQEAELVASIILEWASVLDRVSPGPAADSSLHRVQTALGDRQGWL